MSITPGNGVLVRILPAKVHYPIKTKLNGIILQCVSIERPIMRGPG